MSKVKKNYSYAKASIGSKAAAFAAGYQPKNIPTAEEKAKDRTMAPIEK